MIANAENFNVCRRVKISPLFVYYLTPSFFFTHYQFYVRPMRVYVCMSVASQHTEWNINGNGSAKRVCVPEKHVLRTMAMCMCTRQWKSSKLMSVGSV